MSVIYRNKMKITITSIELKSPFKIFALLIHVINIVNELSSTNCLEFKRKGGWTKHYTITIWRNNDDIKKFVYSGAHMYAIKKSKKIVKEIRTLTIEANSLPSWKEAFYLLKTEGKPRLLI